MRVIKWSVRRSEHEACMREIINAYIVLVGIPEEKRPLGRHRRRWMILKWILK
jgi:hypothetical protein